jgi:hypothetical protein
VIDFIAYVDATTGKGALCGHEKNEETSDEEKESND